MCYLLASMYLSVVEIVLLAAGAFLLGFVTYFFIVSKKNQKNSPMELQKLNRGLDEWKRKYFNDIEAKEKQIDDMNQRYYEAEENNKIYKLEIEELKRQVKKVTAEFEVSKTNKPEEGKTDYMSQLRQAQTSLLEHNEKINQLLQQIDVVKETEQKHQEILRSNGELTEQVEKMRKLLKEKESEINHIRQKQNLASEMSSMLDNAYSEFNVLQSKISKLETQLSSSKMLGIEYEDLKEAHYKLTREFEEARIKLNTTSSENLHLQAELSESEEKLREANFQRQQLQKKVTYLEELNNDLKQMSEANKKLETQIKRIGELESMLNIISEERDDLKRKNGEEE